MQPTILAILLAATVPESSIAAGPARTAKERQAGKAYDEQRVDDCKVPPARRTRQRPADCPRHDTGR